MVYAELADALKHPKTPDAARNAEILRRLVASERA